MIWNAKPKPPQPKEGDRKEKIRFALFPCKVVDKWIWLEKFIGIYEYKRFVYINDRVVRSGILFESYVREPAISIGWIQIDRKLIEPKKATA